jgi:hypothetical protein
MTTLRRGIPAARTNLWVARIAAEKYLAEKSVEKPDPYRLMLYYGAFFLFVRSALEALKKSDGKLSPSLSAIQEEYFAKNIKGDGIFRLLMEERNKVGHGDDAWAAHPFKPLSMLIRFEAAGHDWSDGVFADIWPEEPFKGQSIEDVLNQVWRRVSNWLDAIDALDQKQHEAHGS